MKGSSAVVAGTLLAGAARAQVVQWAISKREPATVSDMSRLRRRASTLEATVTNRIDRGGYFVNCKVGTPPQDFTLQLDTGSSDIWVPSSAAPVCEASTASDGCTLGSFDARQSTSFQVVGSGDFSIAYVDRSFSRGDYFTDVFTIGGESVSNMTMGLGNETNIPYGLVGIGYAFGEAIVSEERRLSAAYPNLPLNMAREGLINTAAYSLWLNDLDASTGNILFGGIDTKKYYGDLTRIQINSDSSTSELFTSFRVTLSSLTATSSSGSDILTSESFPISVVLDSGTTLSYLPTDLAEQIWTEVGAVYDMNWDLAMVPCSMQNSAGYFLFGFAGPSGPRITVNMDELVLDLALNGPNPLFSDGIYKGQDMCSFGVQNFSAESGATFLLGDTFLRSAYVVYDLANNEIGIAPTDFNATDSNIVPFPSANATIPSATAAPSQAAATQKPTFTNPVYLAKSGFAVRASTKDSAGEKSLTH
ncbi:acid protease [Thozetella sp. PMI_491]|nr:acid protease [Thozetella sp. PMI_491]